MTQEKGKLIILNGVSSSGKSSISKSLQEKVKECYLHFRMDSFWDMVPSHIEANSENFPELKDAMIDSLRAILLKGYNVIADVVCMPEQMEVMLRKLDEFAPYVVFVSASLDELMTREVERGDRKLGLAKEQYEDMYKDSTYDFKIDTTNSMPDDVAEQILESYSKR